MRVNGICSDDFDIRTGVRQGAITSPVIFNYAADGVMSNAASNAQADGHSAGVPHGDGNIADVDFADYVAIIADDPASLVTTTTRQQCGPLREHSRAHRQLPQK